ncbi:MAG: hypothetical protein FJZ43_05070 [Candidatus Staskawiczbacteria bacterium]|nr:hypothetical protein [Candidatus Staskawiczbacteria bacterium]
MNQKRVLAFVFISLMLFGLIPSLVSAQLAEIFQPVADFAKSVGSGWSQGEGYSFGVTKFFILIIVWILIFAVLDKFPGFKDKTAVKFFLSLAVTFLATAYITASELAVLVSSYSALGFVLGGILPFMIMFFFTTSTISSVRSKIAKIWIVRSLWAAFGIYFVYKILSMGNVVSSKFVEFGHWILVAVSVLIVFATPMFVNWAMREQLNNLTQLVKEDALSRAELRNEKAKNVEAIRDKVQNAKGLKDL